MAKIKLFLALTLHILFSNDILQAQNVNIPNANFKAALVLNSSINTNGDSEIQVSEAQAFTGQIDVSNKNISNLTGIEAFTNIYYLNCQDNQLTSLNLTANTALVTLNCNYNQISSLNISTNTALVYLYCSTNQLTSVNLSNNTALREAYFDSNLLTSLDVSNNTALRELVAGYNNLTTLDISACPDLNLLTGYNNQLTSINAKNGNNTNFIYFEVSQNPNLTCIQVDDVAYSTANWTFIPPSATFSTNCFLNQNEIATAPIHLNAFPNPTTGQISINLGENYNNIDLEISNLMGQTIFSKNYTATQQLELEITGASGLYLAKIRTEKGEAVINLLKN